MKIKVWTAEGDVESHENASFAIIESGALLIDLEDESQVAYAPTGWRRLETHGPTEQ